jgi:hypothetical protein
MNSNDVTNVASLSASVITINGTVLTGSTALIAADATDVAIADAGSYFAGVTAELALQELGLLTDGATATEIGYLSGTTSAIQTQLDTKAPLASPALTGTPTAPTATAGTDTTQLATTAFVQASSSAAGGLALIESQDASASATLAFTGFDATKYDSYLFELTQVKPTTDNVILYMLTSSDGGSTYDNFLDYSWSLFEFRQNGATPTTAARGSAAEDQIRLSSASNLGNGAFEQGWSGSIRAYSAASATRTCFTIHGINYDSSGFPINIQGGATRTDSVVVDAVRFYMSTGTIASGTISMYGLRNS